MEEYIVAGKSAQTVDAVEKVTGVAKYASDVRLPGMLVGKILRSPFPHARIKGIDTARAAQLPGVKAIVTSKDIPKVRIGSWVRERTILAFDKVRHVGEQVAAVAAVDEDTAEEAIRLIKVDYEELPVVSDPEEAMKDGAPVVHEELRQYWAYSPRKTWGNVLHQIDASRGNVDSAFKDSDIVVEGKYTTQFQHPAFIQSHEVVAEVAPSGKLTVWASTKAPFPLRGRIADALQIPLTKLRVVGCTVGGDFGGKGMAHIEPVAALLALKTGKPVRIVMDWSEEFSAAFIRSRLVYRIKTGVKKDGTVTALQADIVADVGAYCEMTVPAIDSGVTSYGPYDIPNIKITTYNVHTNNIPTGHVRSPRSPQLNMAVESHMDVIASKLGMDPLELRLKNCVQDGDVLHDGRKLSNVGLGQTIRKAREYLERVGGDKMPWTGWGVSCGQWSIMPLRFMVNRESAAKVTLNEDGTVVLTSGVAETGGGQLTVLAQIVSEVLKISLDHVSVIAGDTDTCTFESGTIGSRTTYQVGNTVKQAAEDARRKILRAAARKLLKDEQELIMKDGLIYPASSPKDAIPLEQIAREAMNSLGGPIIGLSERRREELIASVRNIGDVVDAPDYGTHAALVEVDPETGKVKVLKYLAVHDIGFAINPVMVEGQVQGGVVFGLGYALSEDTRAENGRNLARGFTDYKLPVAPDIPPIDMAFVTQPSTYGPFGAKGIGEPPTVPVAAAIANAVFAATGVRICDLPIAAEKVLAGLRKAGRRTS